MEKTYPALVVRKDDQGQVTHNFEELTRKPLHANEVEIAVKYSSLNYKDALAFSGHPGVTQKFPHVPGIDAAGAVLTSKSSQFREGDEVIVTGYDLGMNTHGGLGKIIVVPDAWVVKKPSGLSLLAAMQLGTAGFTAAQSVTEIYDLLPPPGNHPIVVTGATGGVGILATALLHHLGYTVHAISRKASQAGSPEATLLKTLCGLTPEQIHDPASLLTAETQKKPLLKSSWLSAVDTIGGEMIAYLLKTVQYRGCITTCGIALGTDFQSSLFPFILRGVRLIGIDSAECPYDKRLQIWENLSTRWKLETLDLITKKISLSQTPHELTQFASGNVRGRIVVDHQL